MLEAYSNTKWTTTRVAPTNNAPFSGLGEPTPAALQTGSGTPTSSGAFAGAQQGVVLVLLGLGVAALWHGLKQGVTELGDFKQRTAGRDYAAMLAASDSRKQENASRREKLRSNEELVAVLKAEARRRGQKDVDWDEYFRNSGLGDVRDSSVDRRLRSMGTETLYQHYFRAQRDKNSFTASAAEEELKRRGKDVLPKGVK